MLAAREILITSAIVNNNKPDGTIGLTFPIAGIGDLYPETGIHGCPLSTGRQVDVLLQRSAANEGASGIGHVALALISPACAKCEYLDDCQIGQRPQKMELTPPPPPIEFLCETCGAEFPSTKGSSALVQALLHLNKTHGFHGVFSGDAEQRPQGYEPVHQQTDHTRRTDGHRRYVIWQYQQQTPKELLQANLRLYLA
ncbi:MAG: hypothetical protein WC489_02090 [Patescibacteria group bacterium]